MSMRREAYESLHDILNAGMLAEALGISRAGAYQLLNSADFPKLQIGKRKMVPKAKLIAWIDRHTGGDVYKRQARRTARPHFLQPAKYPASNRGVSYSRTAMS